MEEALEAFEPVISRKPIKCLVMTHFHRDHTGGAGLVLSRFPSAAVYAHETHLDTARSQVRAKPTNPNDPTNTIMAFLRRLLRRS